MLAPAQRVYDRYGGCVRRGDQRVEIVLAQHGVDALVAGDPEAARPRGDVLLAPHRRAGQRLLEQRLAEVLEFAVGVVALTLWERLHAGARATMRFATAAGLMWAVALVASGLIFTHGMTTIHDLANSDHASAMTWSGIAAFQASRSLLSDEPERERSIG